MARKYSINLLLINKLNLNPVFLKFIQDKVIKDLIICQALNQGYGNKQDNVNLWPVYSLEQGFLTLFLPGLHWQSGEGNWPLFKMLLRS